MAEKLTRQYLDALKPGAPVVHDAHATGLRYVPSKTTKGAGKWVYRYVSPVDGARRDAGLGSYPKTAPAVAREAAAGCAKRVREGVDPVLAKAGAKLAAAAKAEAAAAALTFETAARKVHAQASPGFSKSHSAQWLFSLERYVFPTLGAKLLTEITKADCAAAIEPIWRAKPEMARRTLQRVRKVLDWAEAHDLIAANPANAAARRLPSQNMPDDVHHPALPWRDVPAFRRDLLAVGEPVDLTRAAVLFVLLTVARSGEALHATWAEIDLEAAVWTVPARRMKMRKPHRVPLSPPALALLRAIRAAERHPVWVFPSSRANQPRRSRTLAAFMQHAGGPSDVPGRAATLHGFRSSFRDWASENRYDRDLAERALAHRVRNKVEAAYHRTDLLDERRPMMDAWSAHCLTAK